LNIEGILLFPSIPILANLMTIKIRIKEGRIRSQNKRVSWIIPANSI
jgi:hypothetical protein